MKSFLDILKGTRLHLMTGVSYMVPFVVAGGILLAFGVMITGEGSVPQEGTLAKDLFDLGAAGLGLMVPILAAYIGFSIAGRPGLAPAGIAGVIANTIGAGFLGGLLGGLIGGIAAYYLKQTPVPKKLHTVVPIFIVPIVGTLIAAGGMLWVFGPPVAAVNTGLTEWLKGMDATNAIVLAAILGLFIGFDLGGPVNKVAYAFMLMSVGAGVYGPVAAISVAICTPPIGMGIATLLSRRLYSDAERETGIAGFLMGSIGITEGAIPFAASDPLRVIPSTMIGSAVGAATAAILGVKGHAAWGGLIVIPVIEGKLKYLIAIAVGALVTALMVNILKTVWKKKQAEDAEEFELSFE